MQNWLLASLFGYPIAEEQIKLLNLFGINGNISLWLIRLLSFLCLTFTLLIWFKIIKYFVLSNVSWISIFSIFISPLFLILVLVYPLICLKLLIFIIGIYLGLKNKYIFGLLAILLIVFNWQVLGNKAAIFNKLNLKDAQNEVTQRISSEDTLKESINMPLWWRRISYNKYFFSYKQILTEIIPFFDFESIFFQEINPLAQKSIVIFYWPEIYLFVLGLYFLIKLKNNSLNRFLLIIILLSWIDFVFSEGQIYKRLVLIVFPVSIVIGLGFYNLYILFRKFNVLATIAFAFISIFIFFGIINSFIDLNTRRDYWLDNRPVAYQFWFTELKKIDLNKYNNVQISTIIGDSKAYCLYYLGDKCNSNKFIFNSFDLSITRSLNIVYAGFAGEFVGSDFKNIIKGDWDNNSIFNIFSKKLLRDTIAYKYGNDLGVGVVK